MSHGRDAYIFHFVGLEGGLNAPVGCQEGKHQVEPRLRYGLKQVTRVQKKADHQIQLVTTVYLEQSPSTKVNAYMTLLNLVQRKI